MFILALLAITVMMLVWLCIFMALPIEPFAFYKDLGYNWEVIDWAAHASHRPVDVIDSLGWAPWNSVPLFYLNSYLGDVVGVAVSIVVGNSWLAIKIVQALQVCCAFAGAFALYRQRSPSLIWAYAFGLVYATVPATALTIRWNGDFGWISALLPGTIALGHYLVRRFGGMCLPLVGLSCGIIGFVIALQYLAFVTLPALAIIICSLSGALRRRDWLVMVPIGVASALCVGAFFFLPSFDRPLFSDSVIRAGTLSAGAFLDNFSEEWLGLLTLIDREWYASPVAEFNAASSLPILVLPGLLTWTCALGYLIRSHRNRDPFANIGVICVVLACIALSLGTTLPLGRIVWDTLFKIPHVNAIRTTDRFLEIPELFVPLWFVCGLEAIGTRVQSRRITSSLAAIAVIVIGIAFDFTQHCFTVDGSKGVKEPQLDRVQRVVTESPGRVTSLAAVNGGALEDAPMYGRPAPFVSFADTDLGGRFLADGIGAAGAFEKMGIGNVVTSPSWTYDAPAIPSPANIYRVNRIGRLVFQSPEDVLVSQIPAREPVSATRIACTYGGPGAFDHLDVAPDLLGEAFGEPGKACDAVGFVDFDPRDSFDPSQLTDSWAGAALVNGASRIQDIDYAAFLNRTLLNIPWYRNSVDGDRPVFDPGGAILLQGNGSFPISHHRAWNAGSLIELRIVAHSSVIFTIKDGDDVLGSVIARARTGFQWLSIPLGRAVADNANLRATYEIAEDYTNDKVWKGIALDGLYVGPHTAPQEASMGKPIDFIAASLDKLRTETTSRVGVRSDFAPSGPTAPFNTDGFLQASVSQTPSLIPEKSGSVARFRWSGGPGEYTVEAQAVLKNSTSVVMISSGHQETALTRSEGETSFAAYQTYLRHGDVFVVRYLASQYDASLGDRITRLSVASTTTPRLQLDGAPEPTIIDFKDPFGAASRLETAHNLHFDDAGARGNRGSSLTTSFRIPHALATVSVELTKDAGGSVVATLTCGTTSVQRVLGEKTLMTLARPHGTRCELSLLWTAEPSVVQEAALIAVPVSQIPRVVTIWLPRGLYDRQLINRDGTIANNLDLEWQGCRINVLSCRITRSGYYAASLGSGVTYGSILLLTAPRLRSRFPYYSERTAAQRWSLRLDRPSDVALTELYDGNWLIRGQAGIQSGVPCDITRTCFARLSPGRYVIMHRYSPALAVGITVSVLAIIVASTLAVLAIVTQMRTSANFRQRKAAVR